MHFTESKKEMNNQASISVNQGSLGNHRHKRIWILNLGPCHQQCLILKTSPYVSQLKFRIPERENWIL